MARRIFLILLALAVPVALLAQNSTLTPAERERAAKHLETSRDALLKTIDGLSPEQWKWKPAPDRWSVSECAEHITATEGLVMELIQKLMQAPAGPPPEKRTSDDDVVRWVRDRSQRFQAPTEIRPTGRFATREELVKKFTETRARSINYVRTTQDDLHSRTRQHPAGQLDAYQWFLLTAAHTERHLEQIREVMAAEGFPKK